MCTGTDTQTHMANAIEKKITYVAIPISAPKLQNADGTIDETADDLGKVIYKSVNGVWTCEHTNAEGTFDETVTAAATCEADGLKTIFCHCGGGSYTEVIPALGHKYEAVVTAPTCAAVGNHERGRHLVCVAAVS